MAGTVRYEWIPPARHFRHSSFCREVDFSADGLKRAEKWYPLRVLVCEGCWLVQTEDFVRADEMFSDEYAYHSSFSTSWLDHARRYSEEMIDRFDLVASSFVVEVASNDGYLLQNFRNADIPCLGVEPTAGTAEVARKLGIETLVEFFGVALARKLVAQRGGADLIAANNVLAHVPDINDFLLGFAALLGPDGVATFEFPHLLNLVRDNQFDTIYHEHYSYLSLSALTSVFATNGLSIFDVEKLSTHGGSLRVFAQRVDSGKREVDSRVKALLSEETTAGVTTAMYYEGFQSRVLKVKNDLLEFLLGASARGQSVVAYGAAAKGNTLLNFAGVRPDFVSHVIDRNPSKQGRFMPGSRIPIVGEPLLEDIRPDYIFILPWNLHDEVMQQLAYARAWGAKFVTAIPGIRVE